MNWIRRGRQLGQAVKNYHRLRQILAVFARHGFTDVVVRMNLERFLPPRWKRLVNEQGELSTAEHLRQAFEELGPTFVKLGQLLSSRPDLVPDNLVEELSKLQDNVAALPFEKIQEAVEKELGRPLNQAFAEFNPVPLAAASIAQVHDARLPTGEKVVVKVQRPGIDRTIDQDVALLAFLAQLLEKYVPESRIFAPSVIVDEFFRTLHQELDFAIESNNMAKMSENLKVFPDIVIPRVYRSHSTHKVLTQERLEGIRVNDVVALDAAGIDRSKINALGARAFFKSVMIDGLFHGDLHAGNLFVLPGNKIGIIDFGIVGRLSFKSRQQLSNMVLALISEDFESLCYQYAELGSAGPSVDFEGFQREVRNVLSPYLGLTLDQMNSGRVLIEATRIASRYDIRVPGDWMIVFKALFTMEGMGRQLDPGFDMMSLGRELAKDLVKDQYSVERLTKEAFLIGRDFMSLLQVLPRQMRWALKKFSQDGFAFEVKSPELREIREQLDLNARRSSLSTLCAGLFIACAIASGQSNPPHEIYGYPLISVLMFVSGAYCLWRFILHSRK